MWAQVREVQLDYREATGPCKARVLAQALWAGEAFVLQLDAHMRFAPGWDASLVKWLCQAEAAHPGTKPVLSTYPPGFEVQPPSWAARALCSHLLHPHNIATSPRSPPSSFKTCLQRRATCVSKHAQVRQHLYRRLSRHR